MKIYLGLDVSSSSTGWSVIDVDSSGLKLKDYGLIKPDGNMGVTQRLYFFGNELRKVIEKYKPNEIAMEETILVRGPKIMRTLSRFSGVAIYLAYSFQKREVSLFEPSMWKKILGLRGGAKKPEIQLAICKIFKLIDEKKQIEYQEEIDRIELSKSEFVTQELESFVKNLADIELKIKEFKAQLKLKKKQKEDYSVLEQQLIELQNKYKLDKTQTSVKRKESKKSSKDKDSQYTKVSTDIYSDSGINQDIGDAIGVTIACIKTLEQNEG